MISLKKFLLEKMRMSHIYQPVMIMTLLQNKGKANKKTIANQLLGFDFSQIEYYENVVNNMVGKVLIKNQIVTRTQGYYSLNDYDDLDAQDIAELIAICEGKIESYIAKRGDKIWEHRRKNRKAVPGSVRYQVLKRALGRCELCGISKEEKALEVDHIVPKNNGGKDSIENYQALCFTCNANKRDTDDTDFRNLNAQYAIREKDCVFCSLESQQTLVESHLASAFYDKFPVSTYHTLIIPKRHCANYFDLSQPELNALHSIAHQIREILTAKDPTITGYNIGFNAGSSAGQTIDHCHMHIIPRRNGDLENPIGGIRNVFPGKGEY